MLSRFGVVSCKWTFRVWNQSDTLWETRNSKKALNYKGGLKELKKKQKMQLNPEFILLINMKTSMSVIMEDKDTLNSYYINIFGKKMHSNNMGY